MYCAGHHKVVKVLQENGADLNFLYDSESNAVTPLMFAVQYAGMMRQQQQPWVQHGAVIQILLRGGCDGKCDVCTSIHCTHATRATKARHVTSFFISGLSLLHYYYLISVARA